MDNNIIIAKKLVKIAKSLVAGGPYSMPVKSVDEMAKILYASISEPGCFDADWHIKLPSLRYFATDSSNDGKSHVWHYCDDIDAMGTAYGKIFDEYEVLQEGDSFEYCKDIAQQIWDIDKNFKYGERYTKEEFFENFIDKSDWNWKELDIIEEHIEEIIKAFDNGEKKDQMGGPLWNICYDIVEKYKDDDED